MPLRDLVLFTVIFGSVPFIISRPHVGILVFAWLGYMNPHRLSWGPAYDFQFSKIIAAATILSTIAYNEPKKLPSNSTIYFLIIFVGWCGFTTFLALNPVDASTEWSRFLKIQIMTILCLMLINNLKKLDQLIWVVVCSIGFFGLKGGLFTLRTGGAYRVEGPPDSFITGNTEIGFALVIIFPLLWYLMGIAPKKWIRYMVMAVLGCSALAIVGTQSRGAFLAGGFVIMFLWLKRKHKIRNGILLLLLAGSVMAFMPEKYFKRMETIKTYEQDGSAMGRINAWWFAYNLACDRPIGGGFNAFTKSLFFKYAPNPTDHHDAHSIYFEVLGEQGFLGLALFLLLGIMSWRNTSRVIRQTGDHPFLKKPNELARMLQVSIVAYSTGGAFLGLAYFDLLYHIVAFTVILRVCVEKMIHEQAEAEAVDSQPAVA